MNSTDGLRETNERLWDRLHTTNQLCPERAERQNMKTRKRGNGSIFRQKGCSTWTLQYYATNGKRIRESTGTTDHKEAQQILRQKLSALDKGESPDLIRKVKVREL